MLQGCRSVRNEDSADRLPLLVGEEMAVTAALLVGLVPHELVDDSLIDSTIAPTD